ncbi:MAG: hypothetical protein N4A61_04780 [Pelagimonas sp.]|jgi:hypothetical protein|nr:hypothetical protein [Pelagimonas sp.]
MALEISVAENGLSATISGRFHTQQIVGLDHAERQVAFYRKLVAGKSGRFYRSRLAACQEVLRIMRDRAGAS